MMSCEQPTHWNPFFSVLYSSSKLSFNNACTPIGNTGRWNYEECSVSSTHTQQLLTIPAKYFTSFSPQRTNLKVTFKNLACLWLPERGISEQIVTSHIRDTCNSTHSNVRCVQCVSKYLGLRAKNTNTSFFCFPSHFLCPHWINNLFCLSFFFYLSFSAWCLNTVPLIFIRQSIYLTSR